MDQQRYKFSIFPQDKCRFICFTGIDGSGKTKQAKLLVKELTRNHIPCTYVWCRWEPLLLRPLVSLGKYILKRKISKTGSKASNYSKFQRSKNKLFRLPGLPWLWQSIALLDYYWQAYRKIKKPLKDNQMIVCDRYMPDIIVDFSVNFNYSGDKLMAMLNHPLLSLFPRPDYLFLLDIPPKVGYDRKSNDISLEYLIERREKYLLLSQKLKMTKLNGVLKPSDIINRVISLICNDC